MDILQFSQPSWLQSVDYDWLLQHTEVRDLIAEAAKKKRPHLSGEKLLEIYDAVSGLPGGIKLAKLAAITTPILSDWGFNTGKNRAESFVLPVGQVIVAALCSLAAHGRDLTQVQQAPNGCILHATLPSDIFSFAGTLFVAITADEGRTDVAATTKIPGQVFDWGKSTRCLRQLFDEIGKFSLRRAA